MTDFMVTMYLHSATIRVVTVASSGTPCIPAGCATDGIATVTY